MALLDDIMISEEGRIGPELLKRTLNKSPWIRLVDRGPWPDEMGTQITVMTSERTLPASDPVWVTVTQNDGTGNSCVPPAHQIGTAQTARTYNLQQVALEGPRVCANDVRFAWQRTKTLEAMFRNLTENAEYLWSERHRDEYTRMAAHKVILREGQPEDPTSFPLQVPLSRLTQGCLDYWHMQLTRDGAGTNAVATVDNRPQYIVMMSPESQAAIFRDIKKTGIRDDFRWSKRAEELLGPLGVERAYAGYFHMIDDFPPRWNFVNGAWVRVKPWVASAATRGTKYTLNPAYQTALYEDTIIYHKEVFKCLLPNPITNPGGGTKFDPLKALGDWRWLNIPDREENPDGNWGNYRSVFSSGSEPLYPDFGVVIRTKRCDFAYQILDCGE